LGKKIKDKFGHFGGAILSGFVGMKKPKNHGVPYSLTEEFVSVYRMHQLLPDSLHLRDISDSSEPGHNKSPKVTEEYDYFYTIITHYIFFYDLIKGASTVQSGN